jgi:hypothetical protein
MPLNETILPYARVYYQRGDEVNIHLQSPLMSHIAAQAKYIVTDTKHMEDGFLHTSIVVWDEQLEVSVAVARMRHTRQTEQTFSDFFNNFFETLQEDGVNTKEWFNRLEGSLFDFSTAEAYGYLDALVQWLGAEEGRLKFDETIKGCQVHWLRSVKHAAKLVCSTEKDLRTFETMAASMPFCMKDKVSALIWFNMILQVYPGLKKWADWWTHDAEGLHLRMLIRPTMSNR